jgi:FAD/FMN-containing dehydrogenase
MVRLMMGKLRSIAPSRNRETTQSLTSWTNWAGNQTAHPAVIEHPETEDELVAVVQRAAAAGQQVKVVGSGHSFTDIAVTTGDSWCSTATTRCCRSIPLVRR